MKDATHGRERMPEAKSNDLGRDVDPSGKPAIVAVDLGAASCRVSLPS